MKQIHCCQLPRQGLLGRPPMVWRHMQPAWFAAQPASWWHNVLVEFNGEEQKAEEHEERRRLLWIRWGCMSQLCSCISTLTCGMVLPSRVYFSQLCPNPATSAWNFPQSLFMLQPLHSGPQPLCCVTCRVPLHSSTPGPRPSPAAPALRGHTFFFLTCHYTSRCSVTPSAVVKLICKWAMQSMLWHLSKLTISLGM